MKSLVIAAVSSAALLMGASAGFASTSPAHILTAGHAGYSQLAAGDTNNDKFRCLEGQNSGRSFDPNLAFCTT